MAAPWSRQQGNSGFAWSWLGAALHTAALSYGTVSAPGQRYHPAIIAQAAATLAEMYPDRFWLAVGTGEALNEHITGEPWPAKPARMARLRESVAVMRALFAGEMVNHVGWVKVHGAKLYSRPEHPPLILGAAREGKPMYLQSPIAFAATEADAEAAAHEGWRTNVIGSSEFKADVPTADRALGFDLAPTAAPTRENRSRWREESRQPMIRRASAVRYSMPSCRRGPKP